MIDFHTHILPNMDDGSSSVQMSLDMLFSLKEQGVTEVALTSHFYPDRESVDSFLERRDASYKRLLDGLPVELKTIKFHLGAEVFYCDGIEKSDDLKKLVISDLNMILIEMPFEKWNERTLRSIYEINNVLGIDVVLAHIERYLQFGNVDKIKELHHNGIKLQINGSIIKKFGLRHKIFNMYKSGMIDFIGSDCHNMNSRPPEIKQCIEKLNSLR